MQFYQVQDTIAELVESITEQSPVVCASLGGLDIRSGGVYIGEDFIASLTPRWLDYYGGFEYIDPEYIQVLGELKIYSGDSERVKEFLEVYRDKNQSSAS